MVNKKAWLRIIEATVAILLITGSVMLATQQNKPKVQPDLSEQFANVLEEVAKNPTLRDEIANSADSVKRDKAEQDASNYIEDIIGISFSFKFQICDASLDCLTPSGIPGDREIYNSERIVSTNPSIQDFNPKRIILFVWKS